MSKRVACLGTFAVVLLAANPPGAAKAWDCYDHPCHTRYYTNCYYQCYERTYARYPRYVYHRDYEVYPRRYVHDDSCDRNYYRYYSSYRYEDEYAW
jgi:hypothetical protein